MLLTLSPSSSQTASLGGLSFSPSAFRAGPAFLRLSKGNNVNVGSGRLVIFATNQPNNRPTLEVLFEPLEEIKKELLLVPTVPHASLARQKYSDQCVAAIDEQINVEYNVSYVYHSMYAYFDRDNVALKGLAKFFKESSVDERQHAEKLMDHQNKRGGKVKLQSMLMPFSEFDHDEKGDALHAMELALALEKLNDEELLNLHKIATENNDVQLVDFIECEFLTEQVEAIQKISEYVAQLRRVGPGHGVWHFDQMFLNDNAEVAARRTARTSFHFCSNVK